MASAATLSTVPAENAGETAAPVEQQAAGIEQPAEQPETQAPAGQPVYVTAEKFEAMQAQHRAELAEIERRTDARLALMMQNHQANLETVARLSGNGNGQPGAPNGSAVDPDLDPVGFMRPQLDELRTLVTRVAQTQQATTQEQLVRNVETALRQQAQSDPLLKDRPKLTEKLVTEAREAMWADPGVRTDNWTEHTQRHLEAAISPFRNELGPVAPPPNPKVAAVKQLAANRQVAVPLGKGGGTPVPGTPVQKPTTAQWRDPDFRRNYVLSREGADASS